MKFGTGGMWGQAVYFAVNSSYSNCYSSKLSDRQSQMFYARVIVGKPDVRNSDPSIKMPNLLPGS